MAQEPELSRLKNELSVAKDDLRDAQQRIERIEKFLWGKDPMSLEPDPNALVTIMRDLRDKMPDLNRMAEDYKFSRRVWYTVFGSTSLVGLAILGYNLVTWLR